MVPSLVQGEVVEEQVVIHAQVVEMLMGSLEAGDVMVVFTLTILGLLIIQSQIRTPLYGLPPGMILL